MKPTAQQNKAWHDHLKVVRNAWAKSHGDGEKILAAYQQILVDVKAGK